MELIELNTIVYKFIVTRPSSHKRYTTFFGLYSVCECLGRLLASINSYKIGYNPIMNTPALRVSNCCLAPNWKLFSYFIAGPKPFELDDEIPALGQINTLNRRVDMLLHSDRLSWFRANQYFSLLITAAC